jgi:hypothetical protein
VLSTLVSGMETGLALLLVAACLSQLVGDKDKGGDLGWAGWTVTIYLCRPDAALIPAVAWCVKTWSE